MRSGWYALVGFALLFVAMMALVHVRYDVDTKRFANDRTLAARSGDEPAYVAMMNSMLFDHDLELGSDYRRGCQGGFELGARYAGAALDHHTIVVDRTTNEQAIWGIVYDPKSQSADCLRLARLTERFPPHHAIIEVPAHPVAFPAILAAAIVPFASSAASSERPAGYVMVVVSWLTVVFTYLLGLRFFRARAPAAAAAALLVLSPWLAYSRSYFSEPMIGLAIVGASLAMARRRVFIAGVALFVAIAIKGPFIVVAAAYILVCVVQRKWRDALTLAAVVGALGLALAAFNFAIAATPMIVGSGGTPPPGGLRALYDTLFERDHGLVCFVPWVPFAFVGAVDALRRPTPARGPAISILFMLVVLTVAGNSPGDCLGPRYWVPMLPWLSLAAVRAFWRARRSFRIVFGAAAAFGALIAVTGALTYTDSFMVAANRWW